MRRLTTAVAVAATAALVTVVGVPAAVAAPITEFQAGKMITDSLFYDGTSMTAAQVQSFLTSKGANCTPASGGPACLKDYSVATTARPAESGLCDAVGGGTMTAAQVIASVGAACGISPKVLITLLQKESGLITSTQPTATNYAKATGFKCPDTASCDPAWAGFWLQVYGAARQFKVYGLFPETYPKYQPGTRQVPYHPNTAECGYLTVNIQNHATTALYTYTPYTPNAAALASYPGTGDACSSYGNRNFYANYKTWFGNPNGEAVHGAILAKWNALGGESGRLGIATSVELTGLRDGGSSQSFKGGTIFWSTRSGAEAVWGAIRTRYQATGWEHGALGYPDSGEATGLVGGGAYQSFQYGDIHYSPATGAHSTHGAIRNAWGALKWENGKLGYPTSEEYQGLKDGGSYQTFQGGQVHWSPATGAHATWGAIRNEWGRLRYENGNLGYPTTNEVTGLKNGGAYQTFQGGQIHWSPTTGAHATFGAIRAAWGRQGYENGPLGYPTSGEYVSAGKTRQDFQGGYITWTPTGGAVVTYR